jgi:protein TonB
MGLVIGLHALAAVALYTGVKVVSAPHKPAVIQLTPIAEPVKPPAEVKKMDPRPAPTRTIPDQPVKDLVNHDVTTETPTLNTAPQDAPPSISDNTVAGPNNVGDLPLRTPPSVGVVCPNVRAVQAEMRYPREALRAGVQGEVMVRFTLTTSGRIVNPHIVSATPSVLNRAALAAVSMLACTGVGHDTQVDAPFLFRLTE